MKKDILILSTAEFLAKQDNFAQDSLDPYLESADKYHNGDESAIDSAQLDTISRLSLMADDDESGVLNRFPELKAEYKKIDDTQVRSTKSQKNLEHFSEFGVDYKFDEDRIQEVIAMLAPRLPLSVGLMREKIVDVSGLGYTRLNYIYHDVMDHVWLFNFIKDRGLYSKYRDLMELVGDPFTGHILSRQSELISGIGFTSRRYLLNPDYYDQMSLKPSDIVEHVRPGKETDAKRETATDIIYSRPELSNWLGFVIRDTIANLLLQRSQRGAVKKLGRSSKGDLVSTNDILPLFDPQYIALIIETVAALAEEKEKFLEAQTKLNLMVELALAHYLRGISAAGKIMLAESVRTDDLRKGEVTILRQHPGLSTNYFKKAY